MTLIRMYRRRPDRNIYIYIYNYLRHSENDIVKLLQIYCFVVLTCFIPVYMQKQQFYIVKITTVNVKSEWKNRNSRKTFPSKF